MNLMRYIDRYFLKQPKLRRFVTRLLEGDVTRDVSIFGATIRVHSVKEHGYLRSSRKINSSMLLREELPVLINLASLLGPGDTFVDIGANVGIYSLTLARLARLHAGTRFYAFEANPDTYARLAAHAPAAGVTAYNLALSDHEGSLQFVAGAVSHVFTTVDCKSVYTLDSEPTVSVPCRRLDAMDLPGDSFVLKIDVEGQEKPVLDGASALFAAGRIRAVYLDGYRGKDVLSFLRGHGFTFLDGKSLGPASAHTFHLLALRRGP